jgi:threonine aldolase
MRHAMASAEVGDAHYGDDPTVNRLEERAAELTGRDAAIYLPTGTLCNQVALHVLARSGRVMCEASAHVITTESASAELLSNISLRPVNAASHGLLTAEQVSRELLQAHADGEDADLVEVENTHQRGGGTPMPAEGLAAISAACAERGVPLYLDGARIFNACAATGAAVTDYASQVTAMMFCLSKGLGAPIGSLLIGDADFIRAARGVKALFGADWRQAGVVAAAGLVALSDGPQRLHEDHANARALAEGVEEVLPGSVDLAAVQTNVVFVDISGSGRSSATWAEQLAGEGLLVTKPDGRIRMLTHVNVGAGDITAALAAWRRVAALG